MLRSLPVRSRATHLVIRRCKTPPMASRYAEVHKNKQGPGDARPTALQIVQDAGFENKLTGKVIFITGASSGIGIETARALYKTGAHLFFGVRDTAAGQKVAHEISSQGSNKVPIDVIKLDLNSLASVRSAAKTFLGKSQQLNILVNNAGVMACPEGYTEDGYETQFATNHLGHFLLFQLLKPALLASSTPEFNSRVVNVSSLGHRSSPVVFDDINFKKNAYDKWVAYGQSKTANILMANEIERRYGAKGLHALSLHPGGILTNLPRHLGPQSAAIAGLPGMKEEIKSPEQGAATTVWAAIGREWEGKGGKYLENCQVAEPIDPNEQNPSPVTPGFKPWAYDEEAAKKLWDVSNEMVDFQEK